MTQFWNFMLWVVYPYLMLGSFFIGTVVRMRKPGSVTAKSSELMEKKRLIWGSILFHIGILGVFGGHVIGIFIPETFTDSIGITNEFYHKVLAMGIGGVFGAMTLVGIIVLTYRRFTSKRVAATSTLNDNVVIVALLVTIVLGMMSSFWQVL
ncbi:respiratory nitrate reductase subunit gamma [Lactococcus protaetiae]|uniref:respiratory nitrate reductase subunit gamma n=1 Tax=Lactococcus protaetiae TaxID=2592653 RepID=UPI00247825B4|nr:respiratory nitrate reductase subunit gamma [Lactococcus protaetiae]